MLRFWLALSLVLAAAPATLADVPCCPACRCTIDDVQRVLMVPDADGHPMAEFTCRTFNIWTGAVLPHAVVEILLGGLLSEETGLCADTELIGISDDQGYVTFRIAGGGCLKIPDAVMIRVNGIAGPTYPAIMSPDYAGWDNAGQPGRWNLGVDPSDLGAFMQAYQGGAGSASCHDYNNNGVTDPSDLGIFVAAYRGGTTFCSR